MTRSRVPISILVVVIAAVVAVIAATAGGSTKKSQPPVAASSAISVKQTSVGKVLTDANGRALYLFAGDKPGVSKLSAAGLAVWPAFSSATPPKATGGAVAGQIGTATGSGGGTQITYNGHPLYYFVGDHSPGQIHGQALNEFGARWYVLSATGATITTTPTSAPAPAPTGSGSSSAYGGY
jgi:predicted lipoprotein with Yx(FWY)xxD motif